ncbi:MAG TPA: SCO family protein [Solirubrobacteraceae bacterium]|nr:SCO family protein [Solirubrobacteraceae bacterium]
MAGCGSSAGPASQGGGTPAAATSSAGSGSGASAGSGTPVSYRGPTLQTPTPAPPIILRNYLGQQVDTASYRGKALLVTFIYTHCPDTCPLIVANLHNALRLLGRRTSEVQIVGVSTDPRGDTRQAVAAFLARHEMTGRMQYLTGSRAALVPVWRAWGISTSRPTSQDRVNHSALVYGITGSGKVTVVYPSNFTPADIAHDVPLLAAH